MVEASSARPLQRMNSKSFRQKPLPGAIGDEDTPLVNSAAIDYGSQESLVEPLERHLSLFDVTVIGIGVTVGSGLFVLCGFIAEKYAGPATAVSWLIGGFAACLSGCSYAELSARVPAAGSTYAYAFVSMGELPALIAAACLSVEYMIASAAVARSWGSKMIVYFTSNLHFGDWVYQYLSPQNLFGFSPMGALVTGVCTTILLAGVRESKIFTNTVTIAKVCVVFYMIIGGFFFLTTSNWEPFVPPQYGVAGVMRGATASFFGYIGFDEIACLGGEAKKPKRNLPLGIMLTLVFVTVVYTISAISLTGMQPFDTISAISGFPAAFQYNHATFSSQVTALGEVATLPVVILLTTMAQPRLQHALAQDGMIPAWFGKQDSRGNLTNGTMFTGCIVFISAAFIPFAHLNAMISSAVLIALSITDTSLIMLWHDSPESSPLLGETIMLTYHSACLVTGLAITHFFHTYIGRFFAVVGPLVLIACVVGLVRNCPKAEVFGGYRRQYPKGGVQQDEGYFRTPLVPYLPCLGIFVNWYLLSQLHLFGIALTLALLGITVLYYYTYAIHHSVGNTGAWDSPISTK